VKIPCSGRIYRGGELAACLLQRRPKSDPLRGGILIHAAV
jgi:hypothetical protein